MADLDSDIDLLFQGPLDAFIDARNALAKATKVAAVKTLVKPSLPAWAVNQLLWHRRALVDRLVAAAEAVRAEHQRALAGEKASIAGAEQAHREVLREAVAAAKDLLTAGGHALTPGTLDAVRDTLSALPSPEANGRLTRPLTPRGLDALAGLVLAARPGPIAAPAAPSPRSPVATAAAKPGAKTPADDDAARKRQAREAEKAAREREARRKAAEAALAKARQALADADEAVEQAERDLATRQAARVSARDQLKRAQRLVEELSFGR
ncbi:MAG: hypothetical protein IT181_27225 [Acidobacteria bacterium]|nr:hypothetical protein [Acidobacteriota bacterium]